MADNIYPSTEVKVFKHIGLTNHMDNIVCYINPDNSCYTVLSKLGGNIVKYKATFKIRQKLDEYDWYYDQIVIWNSVYLSANLVKEAMIKLGIEREDFTMTQIS